MLYCNRLIILGNVVDSYSYHFMGGLFYRGVVFYNFGVRFPFVFVIYCGVYCS